jgi:hypothetical protein
MNVTKKNYVKLFSELSPTYQKYYLVLAENSPQILETIFTSFVEDTGEFSCLYDYASEIIDGCYSRFDHMVIDHLTRDEKFGEIVASRISKGLGPKQAVVDAFNKSAGNSKHGYARSRGKFFAVSFIRWVTAEKRRTLSLDRLMARHDESVDRWTMSVGLAVEDKDVDTVRSLQEIGKSIESFISGPCKSPLDRHVAVRLGAMGFENPDTSTVNVIEGLREDGYFVGKTDRAIRLVVDFVRRRLAAWFIVDGLASRIASGLVDAGGLKTIEDWFFQIAQVGTIEEAKVLAETERATRERKPAKTVEWVAHEDTFDDVERNLLRAGIRVKRTRLDGKDILKVWASLSELRPKNKSTSVVFSNGGWYDFSTDESGRSRDLA